MKKDESLVIKAELKITGANTHRVHNMLSLYDNAIKLCKVGGDLGKIYWKNVAEEWERKLRYFIQTGDAFWKG